MALALRGGYVGSLSCVQARSVRILVPSVFTSYYVQAMEAGLREVCRSVRIGKILIQRVRSSTPLLTTAFIHSLCFYVYQDEETTLPKLFYSKVTHPGQQLTVNVILIPFNSSLKT